MELVTKNIYLRICKYLAKVQNIQDIVLDRKDFIVDERIKDINIYMNKKIYRLLNNKIITIPLRNDKPIKRNSRHQKTTRSRFTNFQ